MIARLAIIGVGLIGGSLALALKQAGFVKHVVGCGKRLQNLQKGLELGIIDSFESSVADAVENADVVVVAVPLGAMESVFDQIKGHLSDTAVVTDVGSAKTSVVTVARQALGQRMAQFVPGHPIAGIEKNGLEAAFATLYENRRVILTPTKNTAATAVERVAEMWRQCGASIEYLSLEHHDKILAATSHLPHMLAYTLVHYLSDLNDHEHIFKYAAGGFRDFTRIASSDPIMWRDICLANGAPLIQLIEEYQQQLLQVADAIRGQDAEKLLQLFAKAKSERDLLIGHC